MEDLHRELVMTSISKSKMEDLPKELVISILLRLPAEDLVRCKSVCKSLYSIITTRPFIDVRRKIRNSYILVKYEEDPINRNHAISLLSDETLEIIDTQPLLSHTPLMDSMMIRSRDSVTAVGCCNGVVCLRCIPPHDEYVLWNPATREAKIIPDGLYKSNPNKNMFRHQNMGFGFDSKNNDYKLVSIQRLYQNNPFRPVRPCQQEVEVYSLKAGCWKWLPHIIPTSDMKLAKGCSGGGEMFSWLVWNEEDGEHVISFDMSNEVFITTLLPSPCIIESSSYGNCRNSLMFHKTSLALDHSVKDRNNKTETHNIWVLAEYGVKESWTNLLNVGPFKLLGPSIIGPSIRGFWNNNKVLLQAHGGGCRRDLILVDPSIQKIKDLDIHGTSSMQVFNYQESLAQINATPPISLIVTDIG